MLRKFPSWQAYSYIGCVVRFSGNAAVHGRVQVAGIFGGEAVLDRVGVDAREALDQVQLLGGAPELGLLGEVDRVDDQRRAFPVAARVAHPPRHRPVRAAVGRHDPRVVDHLADDCGVGARLHELHVVVVHARQHRRAGGRPQQAAHVEPEDLPARRPGCRAGAPARAPPRAAVAASAWRRQAAVLRIDDQRRCVDRSDACVPGSHQSGPAVLFVDALPGDGPAVRTRPLPLR